MAMTGTEEMHPVKLGAPAIDYATGMTGAFALASALFQRERTGLGQRIDMAMLDVAMTLMGPHLTGYLRNGVHPKPHGNRTNEERDADHDREIAVLTEIMLMRTADEWEEFLQACHIPAARVRTMGEAVADPQLANRGIIHRHATATGLEGGFGVPLAAFTFAHGGPRIDAPLPTLGQHNEEIFGELERGRG